MAIMNDINQLTLSYSSKVKVFLEVVHKAYPNVGVFEALRTLARQKQLVAAKKSWTLKSKHLEGKAIDLVFYNSK